MKERIKHLLTLALLLCATLAQAERVSGVITGEDGSPVPGANVVAKSTNIGVITGVDGRYSIDVPDGVETLVFSSVEHASIERVITGAEMDVQMSMDAKLIDDIVITGLGVQRQSKSVGYAVSSVAADNMQQKAEPDALRAIEGKVPGVTIAATSGAAGSATKITIRGNSSFYGNNEPLFVVDGVPYSNTSVDGSDGKGALAGQVGAYGSGFSTLDPNDIESMSVLKGAAAAALYGSRAAGGVVLITTKSGSKTRRSQKGMEVSVSSSVSLEQIGRLPEYQNKFGQGSGFQFSIANGSWGPEFGGDLKKIPIYADYLDASGKPIFDLPDSIPYQAYKNNVRDLFQNGWMFDNSVSVSSSNEKGVFNITASDLRQTGYIPDSKYGRSSIGVGGNTTLDNGFRAGGHLSYTMSEQVGGIFGSNQFAGGASSIARSLILPRNFDTSLPYEGPNGQPLFYIAGQADHPFWSTKHNQITTDMQRMVSSANLGYDFFTWLSLDYQIGINRYSQAREEIIDLYSRGAGGLGQITTDNYSNQEIESNLMLTFNKKLTDDISLKAILGQNVNQRYISRRAMLGKELSAAGVYTLENTVSQQVLQDYTTKRRLVAAYFDAAFGYKDWLFLNLTGRNDWSSTLPTDNNSYFYPAVATSFVFTDAFGISNKYLSTGRIRLGWAKVGNDASPYYYNGTYKLDLAFSGQPTMYVPTAAYDPNLKPEFTTEWEVGAELGFFEGRGRLDVTYYDRRTTDQIAPLYLPASTHSDSYITNFGEVKNQGVEIALSATPVSMSSSFEWEITGTYSKNVSEVLALADGVDQLELSTGCSNCPVPTLEVGQPYGVLKGTVAARDDKGNLLINPNTGNVFTAKDKGYLGNPYPDYIFSIGNTLRYKGVALNFSFDGSIGGMLWSNSMTDYLGRGVTKDTENRYGGRIIPGVYGDPNTGNPLLDASSNAIKNQTQIQEADLWFGAAGESWAVNGADEFATYKATVFRLRDITLSYELPKSLLKKTPLGGVVFSLTGRNLWYYAPHVPKYTNYDPVANSFGTDNIQGLEYNVAPSVKRYALSLRLTF